MDNGEPDRGMRETIAGEAERPARFPDAPVTPVIHEYAWPGAPAGSAAAFMIVLKDGQVRRAAAVWMLDDGLHYTGAGDAGGRLALAEIDMESTRKLNAEAGLVWRAGAR